MVVVQVFAAYLLASVGRSSTVIRGGNHEEAWQIRSEGSFKELAGDGDMMQQSSQAELIGIASKFAEVNVMHNTTNVSNATNAAPAWLTRAVYINEVISDDDRLKFRVMAAILFSLPLVLVALCLMGPGFEKAGESAGPADSEAKKSKETSVQDAFESVEESDVEKKTFFETIYKEKGDHVVPALCDDPGIYTLVWATRTLTVDQTLILVLSVILQIFLPFFLFNANSYTYELALGFPNAATGWAKTIWPAIMVFTASTIKGTVCRVAGMLIVRKACAGWGVVLMIGAVTQVTSCVLVILATKSMFYNDPTVRDMLLNACAVNFIPDIDKSLIQLVGTADPRSVRRLAVAKERLAKVSETWPESKERKEFMAWFSKPFREQLWERPYVFALSIVDFLLAATCLVATCTVLYEMCDGLAMWFEYKSYNGL